MDNVNIQHLKGGYWKYSPLVVIYHLSRLRLSRWYIDHSRWIFPISTFQIVDILPILQIWYVILHYINPIYIFSSLIQYTFSLHKYQINVDPENVYWIYEEKMYIGFMKRKSILDLWREKVYWIYVMKIYTISK